MDRKINLAIQDQMIQAIDQWRAKQAGPGIPSRSEAIRLMIQNAIDTGFQIGEAGEANGEG